MFNSRMPLCFEFSNLASLSDLQPLLFLCLFEQAGAKVNMSAGGATPLHIAADIGSLEIIKCLLKAGADPNVTDEVRLTPIHAKGLCYA